MRALVEVRQIDFAYAVAERRRTRPFRLSDLSFKIAPGEIVGVIGPNSAGKTTLTRLLTRVLEPAGGQILLDGRPLGSLTRWELARQIAAVPQEVPEGFPFTVEQLVLMGRYPHAPGRYFESAADLAIAREAMTATGVAELAPLPFPHLSGGERRRAILARALAQRPRVLILDEPTAHLDLRYQAECVDLLRRLNRERGVTILLVSHDLALAAALSDRLLLLAEGRLVRVGPPEQVLDESVLAGVYGCAVTVEKSPGSRRLVVQVVWPDAENPPAGREAEGR